VNAFEYMTALQKHAVEVRKAPAAWLPWNYKTALARPPDEATAQPQAETVETE